jgi:hypothetical protein
LLGGREWGIHLLLFLLLRRNIRGEPRSNPRLAFLSELFVLLSRLFGGLEMTFAELRKEAVPGFSCELGVFGELSPDHEFLERVRTMGEDGYRGRGVP